MSTKQKISNSKLISTFLGYETKNYWWFHTEDKTRALNEDIAKFETDLNQCMELLTYIEKLGYRTVITYDDRNGQNCNIYEGNSILRGYGSGEYKINAIYNACVNFIDWYNSNK